MKKILFTTLLCVMNVLFVIAQGTAEITFEKTSYNFGSFSESSPKVTCKFKFKNTGDGPLVIHQAIASCGCTVPQYPKEPIKPGESGEVTVTYNGAGKFPGHFRKTAGYQKSCFYRKGRYCTVYEKTGFYDPYQYIRRPAIIRAGVICGQTPMCND